MRWKVLSFVLLLVGRAPGAEYTVTVIEVAGGTTSALAINNNGDVAGEYEDGQGNKGMFLYSKGKSTVLPMGRGTISALNARGDIVGWDSSQNPIRPFFFSQGKGSYPVSLANVQGVVGGRALAINARGDITGWCKDGLHEKAFVYSGGRTILLGANNSDSTGYGINDKGTVVGKMREERRQESAFIYADGKLTDLGALLKATESTAYAVNPKGAVIGQASGENVGPGFFWSNGKATRLTFNPRYINGEGVIVGNKPGTGIVIYKDGKETELKEMVEAGWDLSSPAGINDAGQIALTSQRFGKRRAAVLVPAAKKP